MSSILGHLTPVTTRGLAIGGSDVAALIGMSPWGTPFSVFNSIMQGRQNSPSDNRKRWGRRLERLIADAYAEENEHTIEWLDRTYAHPKRLWQVMTPDFLITDIPAGGDSKNIAVDQAYRYGDALTDEIPDEQAIQMQWYMDASGLEDWRVVPLIGGNQLREYILHADREMGEALREVGERFYKDHLLTGREPDPEGFLADGEWIAKRFPRESQPMIKGGAADLELAREYSRLLDEETAATKAKQELQQKIQLRIGDNAGIFLPGNRGSFTWKVSRRAGYSVAPTMYRSFRLNKKGRGLYGR